MTTKWKVWMGLSISCLLVAATAGCGTSTAGDVAGATAVPGPSGPQGPQGLQGLMGPDGQLRIYGDGSAGALTISGVPSKWLHSDVVQDHNLQFTDVTIEAGATLVVPSGTVIRCTGTFTNHGTVKVAPLSGSGGGGYYDTGVTYSYSPPSPAINGEIAGGGEYSVFGESLGGGRGGNGVNQGEAAGILLPGLIGGGGGAGSVTATGGHGGGTLVILAQGGIVNSANATLMADGDHAFSSNTNGGGGGGAGGVIVLASPLSIANSGVIQALGGNGGASNSHDGPGGGGGGGIVHLVCPSIQTGTISVAGGLPGTGGAAGSVNSANRAGGGGGGSCGGGGGIGGAVTITGDPVQGLAGSIGDLVHTNADPTSLF